MYGCWRRARSADLRSSPANGMWPRSRDVVGLPTRRTREHYHYLLKTAAIRSLRGGRPTFERLRSIVVGQFSFPLARTDKELAARFRLYAEPADRLRYAADGLSKTRRWHTVCRG